MQRQTEGLTRCVGFSLQHAFVKCVCVRWCSMICSDILWSSVGLVQINLINQLLNISAELAFHYTHAAPHVCIQTLTHTHVQQFFQLEFQHHSDNATFCWLFSPCYRKHVCPGASREFWCFEEIRNLGTIHTRIRLRQIDLLILLVSCL